MANPEKIKFYPLKLEGAIYSKTLIDIIQEFRANRILTNKPRDYEFTSFVKSILEFLTDFYGESTEPLTVGQISKLYAVYNSFRNSEIDSSIKI